MQIVYNWRNVQLYSIKYISSLICGFSIAEMQNDFFFCFTGKPEMRSNMTEWVHLKWLCASLMPVLNIKKNPQVWHHYQCSSLRKQCRVFKAWENMKKGVRNIREDVFISPGGKCYGSKGRQKKNRGKCIRECKEESS